MKNRANTSDIDLSALGINWTTDLEDARYMLQLKPPFVAREKELERLEACLDSCVKWHGKVVLVCGEAGVGKTRLLDELGKRALWRGVEVLKGSSMSSFSSIPGHPILQALQDYGKKNFSRCFELLPLIRELVELGPGGALAKSDEKRAGMVGDEMRWEKTQLRIFEALNFISQESPVLFILDDVQLADRASLQFIERCPTQLAQSRVLLVLLNSRGELGQQGYIPAKENKILTSLRGNSAVELMELKRLGDGETRTLVHKYLGKSDLSSEFPLLVYRRTDGNPLLVVEEVRGLIGAKKLFHKSGVWYNRSIEGLDDFLGEGVAERLNLRLSNLVGALDEEKKVFVGLASVIGYAFPAELLEEAMGEERANLVLMVEDLSNEFRFLCLEEDKFTFVHPIVRERILESLTGEEKVRFNKKVAEALKKNSSLKDEEKACRLANHLWEAGEKREAVPYLLQAATFLASSSGYTDAVKNLEKAEDGLLAGSEDQAGLLFVKLQLGRLHELLGNWDQSLQYCEEAMGLADALNDPVSKSQALLATGMIEKQRGEADYARKCFETALALAGDEPSIKAVASYRIGNLSFEQGKWDECEEKYMEAMGYARASKAPVLVARIYNNLGAMQASKGNMTKAAEWLEKCIPIYEEENDLFGLASTLHNIATAHLDQGSWREAQAYYSQSLAISDRIGVSWVKCFSFLGRAECAIGVQDIETAEEYAAKAAHLLNVLEIEIGVGGYERVMGMIEREKGRWVKAEEHFERALYTFRNAKNSMGVAETEYEMGILFMKKGEKQRAADWLRSASRKYEQLANQRKLLECKAKLEELEE